MAADNTKLLKDLSQKLDTVVEISREAKSQGDAIQDLVQDLNMISNSAVLSLQDELELENVHVDGRDVRELLILVLKNIRNFNYSLRQLEGFKDLVQELNIVTNSAMFSLQDELEAEGMHLDGREVRSLLISSFKNLENFNYFLNQLECFRDLAREAEIMSNTVVKSLHEELELANVHVDGREVREMIVHFLKNIKNINAAMSQLEAFTELGRETTVTAQKLIMDFTHKASELEQKGYFEHGWNAMQAMDKFLEHLPRDALKNMEAAAPELAKLTAEMSDPKEIAGIRKLIQKRKLLVPALAAAWLIPVALLVANLFV